MIMQLIGKFVTALPLGRVVAEKTVPLLTKDELLFKKQWKGVSDEP